MILHLFPKTQFTEEYVAFLRKHFNAQEHKVVLYTNKVFELSRQLYETENVFDYDKRDICWLYRELKSADRVFLHNLGVGFKELILLWLNKKICDKSIWLIWGADLYCHENPANSAGEKLVEYIRHSIIPRFPIVATLTDGDYELAVKWYNCKGKSVRLEYCEEYTLSLMNRIMSKPRDNDGIVRIVVGNSATRSNQHKEAFEYLEHLKDNNILVYTPLSYGDKEYAEEVIRDGMNIFGNKFVPMVDYMSRDEYYSFLYTVDVGIFNNNRQQATGNIEALLYFGKKIYLRSDTTMWNEWVDKEGYVLNRIQEIENADIEELTDYSGTIKEKNDALIRDYFDIDKRVREWKEVFDVPLNSYGNI